VAGTTKTSKEIEKHIKETVAYKLHKETPTSGCMIRCITRYKEGNTHSHRWNAAERARTETRIPYTTYKNTRGTNWWGRIMKLAIGDIKPFHRDFHPFPHNAHHIIPMAKFHEDIDAVTGMAAPNQTPMYNFVVRRILTEPYNINNLPNMIILPTQKPAAKTLGLPTHTGGHKDYSDMIAILTRNIIIDAYTEVAQEFAAKIDCEDVEDRPEVMVKKSLDAISNKVYEAFIELSEELRDQTKTRSFTLDEVNNDLMCGYYSVP